MLQQYTHTHTHSVILQIVNLLFTIHKYLDVSFLLHKHLQIKWCFEMTW